MRKILFLLVMGIIFIPMYDTRAADDSSDLESNNSVVTEETTEATLDTSFVFIDDFDEDLDEEDLSAGMTPDSAFYFAETVWESFGNFFTFGKKAKAKRYARQAGERILEAEVMAEKGNIKALEVATRRFDKISKRAEQHIERFINDPDFDPELEGIRAKAAGRHEIALARVLTKAPEAAREWIENAIENSAKKHEGYLRNLANLDEELAGKISARISKERLVRIKEVAANRDLSPKEVERALEKHEKYGKFVKELERGRDDFKAMRVEDMGKAYRAVYDIKELPIKHLSPELRDRIIERADGFIKDHRIRLEELAEINPERAALIHGEAVELMARELGRRPEMRAELRDEIFNDLGSFNAVRDRIWKKAELIENPEMRSRILREMEEMAGIHIQTLKRVMEIVPEEAREIINNLIEIDELTREGSFYEIDVIRSSEPVRSFFEATDATQEELLRKLETTVQELTEEEKLRILEQLSGTSELRLDTTEGQYFLDRIREEFTIMEESAVEPIIINPIIEPVIFNTAE